MLDRVELHLVQARAQAGATGIKLASIRQGDARRLDTPANSADAVLLLGPLCQLVDQKVRLAAFAEAKRFLRSRGILLTASISRFASLADGLSRGLFRHSEFREIVEADLKYGLHRNPTSRAEHLTTAYFHRPEELAAEVSSAGFDDVQILAIEGPAWSAAGFRLTWNDGEHGMGVASRPV